MSTSAERTARLKAKGTGDGELGDPSSRAARLKAAEEAAALAVQAAKQAAAAAEAAARTAQELRAEIAAEKGEEEDAEEEEEEAESRNRGLRTPSRDRRRSQSPLRDRRRGRGGGRYESPQGRVVYHDSDSSTSWPMLDKTNYYEWSQTMKLRMQARDLWDAIEGGSVQFCDDRRTLEVIVGAVPKEMGIPLLDKAMAKEAWDAITATRIGVDRVRRATLQRLRRDWENIGSTPASKWRISPCVCQLCTSNLSFMVTRTSLKSEWWKSFYARCRPRTSAVVMDVAAVVDEDEAEAVDEEMAMLLAASAPTPASTATRRATGHVSVPSRGVKVQSTAVEVETVLAVAVAAVVEAVAAEIRLGSMARTKEGMRRGPKQSTPAHSYTAQHVELFQPRAHAYLGVHEEEVDSGWYLDSGATHHMTGRQEFFADLNTGVRGTVRFGDASKVEIKGVGSIVFQAKTGGSKVKIDDGVLRIWDKSRRLLAKVHRGKNRLYILHLEAAQPLCLVARKDDEAWQWHERFGHLHFDALRRLSKEEMDAVVEAIKKVKVVAEVESGRKLKVLRTDNGGEFTVAEFVAYCADEGEPAAEAEEPVAEAEAPASPRTPTLAP
ncbi:uncharacterized protein, partial [Miscanthus floridulus]|uniref:uncharacterized protein n=1 Tax=Miscanthus floridulus TaxID=154761 RepID=UPI0034594C57